MQPDQIQFAKAYRRLLRVFAFLISVMPESRWRGLFFVLGRWLNPYQILGGRIRRSINSALPDVPVGRCWRKWMDSHILFIMNFLIYRALDINWLNRDVFIKDPVLLDAMRASGGLLLTYHTHHQNTLCCALGISGIKISAIAAKPDESPMFPYIGRWATQVNADSAVHFNGGYYIFTNNLRKLLQDTREKLAGKEVVVCLCDFDQPRPGVQTRCELFGRAIAPPTGAIDMAIQHKVPVYVGMFAPQNGRLSLELKRLDEADGIEGITAQYFSFLESCIRTNPACWQGWEWFENLPIKEQAKP